MKRNIVINREYGSGGRAVGKILAKRAKMDFYDTEILKETAKKKKIDFEILQGYDEKKISEILTLFAQTTPVNPADLELPYKAFNAVSDIIYEQAITTPTVFVGRCAEDILRKKGINVLSVFIYSSNTEEKIQRIETIDGADEKNILKHIANKEKEREKYHEFFTHKKFKDLSQYDLCLNTAAFSYERCSEIIIDIETKIENQK